MRAFLDLLRSLLIGGFVFLLPLGIVLVALGKLLAVAQPLAGTLQKTVLPGMHSELLVLVVAIALLLAVALAAGLFARTPSGRSLFTWLESSVLARVPVYTILRQMIMDMADGAGQLGEGGDRPVVIVDFDDQSALGFLIETTGTGRALVYLPGAPSALSGSVCVVDPGRVRRTAIRPSEVIGGMRRLGAGMAQLVEAERAGARNG